MSYLAIPSQGTQLKISDQASPAVFNPITQIVSINGPNGTAPEIDVSDLDSTMRETRTGLAGHGTYSFDILYIPTDTEHQQLRTAWKERTRQQFQLDFTDSPTTTWSWNGFITGFNATTSVDNVWRATVNMVVDGDITET
jgi:hypothetical protein